MADISRPAWIEIDLAALAHNVGVLRRVVRPEAEICAIVKANAYGHGDVEVAATALRAGATRLGVILVDEGVRLREAGITAPILLLHEPPADRADEVIANNLTATVFTPGTIAALGEAADWAARPVKVHLKVDTGLNRLGAPLSALDELAAALAKHEHLDVEGLFTHFAFADQPTNPVIDEQLARFEEATTRVRALGIEPRIRHVANSAACFGRPDAHYDMVRTGIAVYGLSPGPEVPNTGDLRPVLSLRARVAMVKRIGAGDAVSYGHRYRVEQPSTIISIPMGYADGWPRLLTNNAEVLVRGKRYPAAGTVTMDSFMVDLGADPCEVGEEVTLIGAQGDDVLTADEVAVRSQTLNYEVTTRLSTRLPRIVHGG